MVREQCYCIDCPFIVQKTETYDFVVGYSQFYYVTYSFDDLYRHNGVDYHIHSLYY
jgi:hypothetical protein